MITRNMVMIKKPTGRLRIYATKIHFICLDLQKKGKKEVLVKVSFSVR